MGLSIDAGWESVVTADRLAAAVSDGVFVVDQGGQIVYASDRALEMTGYTRDALIGASVDVLAGDMHRTRHRDLRIHYAAHPHARSMARDVRYRCQRADGTSFDALISLTPVVSGRREFVVAAMRDASALAPAQVESSAPMPRRLPSIEEYQHVLEETVQARTAALLESLEELHRTNNERARLLRRLVDAQEEERRRIASDVHDDSIQVMAAAAMRVGLLRRRTTDPVLDADLEKIEVATAKAIARLRQLVFRLRPASLERGGLAASLGEYLREWQRDTGVAAHLDIEDIPGISAATRAILYRIVQEALANVGKHAQAAHVTVSVRERAPGILLRIDDDGVGIAPDVSASHPVGHLGLISMRERAEVAGGWFSARRGAVTGTVVEVWVPLAAAAGPEVPGDATPG